MIATEEIIGVYFKRTECIRDRKCKRCKEILHPGETAYMVSICSYCRDCFTIIAVQMLGPAPFKDEVIKEVTARII